MSLMYAGLVTKPSMATHASMHTYVQAGGPFGAYAK
jgi:hypothetical protein